MGVQTIIHGRITLKGDYEKSRQYIKSLKDTEYPWLRAELFSTGAMERPYYYEQPVIAFAADYKGVEDDWSDFIRNFEHLLRNIEFDSARIQMETEIFGTYNFFWKSKTGSATYEKAEKMIETEEWFFGFGHRNYWGCLTEPLRQEHIFDIDFSYPVKHSDEQDNSASQKDKHQ